MNILCKVYGNDEDRYEKAIFKHFVILNKLFNCYIDELLNKEFIDTVFCLSNLQQTNQKFKCEKL